MAKLYITEYDSMVSVVGGRVPVGSEPRIADQTPVVIGAGSLQSAGFNVRTKFIRVHADAICSVAVGVNPTATVNSMRMGANQTEYFGVIPGHLIAVIANT